MRRFLLPLSLGTGILSSTLVGCNQTARRSENTASIASSMPGQMVATSQVPTVHARIPPTAAPQVAVVITPPPALPLPLVTTPEPTTIQQVAKPAATEPTAAVEWRGSSALAPPTSPTAAEETDMTAFSHSLDYTMLSGVLERGRKANTWVLRYSPAEINDRFGGSVTLVLFETDPQSLHAGQLVRVEGALLDPDAGGSRPGFRVSSLKPIDKP
jgi:hypothetical protein